MFAIKINYTLWIFDPSIYIYVVNSDSVKCNFLQKWFSL